MNSRVKFILGFVMMMVIVGVASFYIYSGLNGDKTASERNDDVSEVMPVKNYMSALSVNEIIQSNQDIPISFVLPTLYDEVTGGNYVFEPVEKETVEAVIEETETETKKEREFFEWVKKEVVEESSSEPSSTIAYVNPYDELFVINPNKISDYLNVREVPGGRVIGIMYPNSWGRVISISDGWAEITSGGIHGYVDAQYLIFGLSGVAGRECVVTVKEGTLYLRAETSEYSYPLNVLTTETSVRAISYREGWMYVQDNDMFGYVASEYVRVSVVGDEALALTDDLYAQLSGVVETEAVPEETEPVVEPQAPVETVPVETAPVETAPVETVPVETTPVETTPEPVPTEPETPAPTTTREPSADEIIAQQIAAYANSGMANESALYLSYNDVYLMACVISIEDGWGTDEGKLAVANCLINRLKNGHWGGDMSSVVYAPGQFYGADGPVLAGWLANGPRPGCMDAAIKACAGINILGDYMYFCSAGKAQYDKFIRYVNIDGNVYYHRVW